MLHRYQCRYISFVIMTASYALPLVCPVNRRPKTSIRGRLSSHERVCRAESPHFPGPTHTTMPAITTHSPGKEELVAWADRWLHRSVLRSSYLQGLYLLALLTSHLPPSQWSCGQPWSWTLHFFHFCLVCKSIYCCIHSFPMCFTGTPKKTVTSGIGSGHSQLSSHLCNCFFSVFQGLFDGSVSLHPSAAPYQFFGCVNEHHVCFPRADSLGSFLFLWYFSSCLQLSADFCLCLFTCLTKDNGKRLYTSLKQPLTYLLLHHLRLQMIANPHAFFSVSIQVSSN